jgi:hypothetical protein
MTGKPRPRIKQFPRALATVYVREYMQDCYTEDDGSWYPSTAVDYAISGLEEDVTWFVRSNVSEVVWAALGTELR